jgi:hypothetical protein
MFLGTAVKIVAILNLNQANSVTVTIKDPSNTAKVSNAAMTKEQNRVYYYVFQSLNTDGWVEGEYTAEITVVYGSYTAYTEYKFILLDPDNND